MVLSSRSGPGETAHVQLLQRSKSYIVPTTSSTSNNTTGGSSTNNSTNNCNNNRNSILEGIHLSNLQDGETLSYGLALVRGRVPATCKRLRVRCLGSSSSSSSSVNNSNNGLTQQQQQGSGGVKQTSQHQWAEWPCVNGDFRLLVELQRGHNRVELEAAGHRRKFGLVYEPRYTRLRVTPVYVICAGHDGYFQKYTWSRTKKGIMFVLSASKTNTTLRISWHISMEVTLKTMRLLSCYLNYLQP
ncbi:hypothetical protein TKK_0006770 [Trichogramma kaykai]